MRNLSSLTFSDRRDVFCYFVRPLKRYPQQLAILNRMRHWKTVPSVPRVVCVFQPIQFTAFISHLTNSNGCGNLYPKVLLTVSPFRPSFSPQSKVYPQPFDSCNPRARKLPFVFNRLRTLFLSCRSFCDSCPLFSITSALFDKNTGGRVSRSGLWTLGGSRRRLPVPETKLRDTRDGIPSTPSIPGGVGPRDLLFPCENENGKASLRTPCRLCCSFSIFYCCG